jgi:hypothetical protein
VGGGKRTSASDVRVVREKILTGSREQEIAREMIAILSQSCVKLEVDNSR